MSVNSLANFGIPGLSGERSATLQPIFSNRFRVLFFNFGASNEPAPYDLTRQVKRCGRPNVTFNIQTLWSYVSAVYVNSRAEWQEITVSFFDDITNSVMNRVENQKAKQQNFFDQTMSRAGENYKFEMDIDILAGGSSAGNAAADPNIIQKWCLAGCQIVSHDYGELNNDNDTPMEITLTLRYDNAIGFNHLGLRMGNVDLDEEIDSQTGVASTGTGTSIVSIGGAILGTPIGTIGGGISSLL